MNPRGDSCRLNKKQDMFFCERGGAVESRIRTMGIKQKRSIYTHDHVRQTRKNKHYSNIILRTYSNKVVIDTVTE